MKKLSPRAAQIVTLVGRDGLEWEVVSEKLHISRSTIVGYVRKAMANNGLANRKPREACVELYLKVVAPPNGA